MKLVGTRQRIFENLMEVKMSAGQLSFTVCVANFFKIIFYCTQSIDFKFFNVKEIILLMLPGREKISQQNQEV